MTSRFEPVAYRLCLLMLTTLLLSAHAPAQSEPRSPAERNILAAGVLESAQVREIRSNVPGQTAILWVVADGKIVEEGELLVQLDDAALKDQHAAMQIKLQEAQANVKRSEQHLSSVELQLQNTQQLSALRQKLAALALEQISASDGEIATETMLLKQTIDYTEALIGEGANNPAIDVGSAELKLAEARGRLQLLEKYIRPRRILEAELKVAEATADALLKDGKLKSEGVDAMLAVQVATAGVRTAEQKVAELEASITACSIHAPTAGLVLHEIPAGRRTQVEPLEEGSVVRERQVLLRIPDLKKMQIRARVHESRIGEVRVGQQATLEFDAVPGRRMTGVVRAIADRPSPATWPNTDIREFEIIVASEDLNPLLRIGMTCLVEIDPQQPVKGRR